MEVIMNQEIKIKIEKLKLQREECDGIKNEIEDLELLFQGLNIFGFVVYRRPDGHGYWISKYFGDIKGWKERKFIHLDCPDNLPGKLAEWRKNNPDFECIFDNRTDSDIKEEFESRMKATVSQLKWLRNKLEKIENEIIKFSIELKNKEYGCGWRFTYNTCTRAFYLCKRIRNKGKEKSVYIGKSVDAVEQKLASWIQKNPELQEFAVS